MTLPILTTSIPVILLILLLLISLLLLAFKLRGNSKAHLVFAIIGGLYALIPLLILLAWGDTGGDPGPMYIWFFLPFLPQFVTFLIGAIPIGLLSKAINYPLGKYFYILSSLISLILWIIIGYFIGRLIKNRKRKKK